MRKILSLTMTLVLLFVFTTFSFGEIDKLCGHWAQGKIDEQFMIKYFDYLAKDNYKDFSPNGNITAGEFTKSIGKLFCEYGFCHANTDSDEVLTRKDMGLIIGRTLIENNIIKKTEEKIPLVDLNNFTKEEKIIISSLYKNNLIKGNSQNLFLPEKNATQVECIVLLKRVKGVLEPMDKKAIPFKVKSMEQVYSGVNEGVTVRKVNDKVEVTIVEMYPTPGYTTNVDKIFKDSTGEYEIYLSENPPKEGSIQLQVITYKVIVLEIDATNLGEKPYTFKTIKHSIFRPTVNQLYK